MSQAPRLIAERKPPSFQTLKLAITDAIATLTLARPEHLNAMSPSMLAELPVATAWLAETERIRALIVTGEGDSFCVGGDLAVLSRLARQEGLDIHADTHARIGQLNQAIVNLSRIPYPVIAAVNGPAAGSGFALALVCDQRLASTTATFTAGYGRLGLTPDGGLSYLLPRMLGERQAMAILIADERIKAREAKRIGLVSDIVDPLELPELAVRRARRLAQLSPRYLATLKQLVGASARRSLTGQLEHERREFAAATASSDFLRGADALAQGVRPDFQGD